MKCINLEHLIFSDIIFRTALYVSYALCYLPIGIIHSIYKYFTSSVSHIQPEIQQAECPGKGAIN
jgi:hypothetical protein